MTTFFRRWTARLWLGMHSMDGKLIRPGDLLRCYEWPILEPPVDGSYLWRVEKRRGMALWLVSLTTGQAVRLTRTRSEILCWVEEPDGVRTEDFAEQLRWAEGSGWGFHVEKRGKGLGMWGVRNFGIKGQHLTPKTAAKMIRVPGGMTLAVTHALLCIIHPVKASKAAAVSRAAVNEEMRLFIQRERRKQAKRSKGATETAAPRG
jgi:hypothetical protein